jgi:hypothetical protein
VGKLLRLVSTPLELPLYLVAVLYIQLAMSIVNITATNRWPWDLKPSYPTRPSQPNQACITLETSNCPDPISFCWNTTERSAWQLDPASGQFVDVTNQTRF